MGILIVFKIAALLKRSRGLIMQLLAFFILPLFVILAFVAYESVSLHEHAMRTLVGERDKRAVQAASEMLTDRFIQRQLMLQILAVQLEGNRESLTKILTTLPNLAQVFDGGLLLLDKQGTIIDSWPSNLDWASTARNSNSPWLVEHDTTTPLVIARAQTPTLTLLGGISLNSLNVPATAGIIRNNPEVRLYLVADDGHILEDSAGTAVGTDASRWLGVNMLATLQPGDVLETHDNQDLITVASRLPTLNWTLVIQEPWEAVVNPALQLSLVAPLAVIPALLLAAAILLFGVRRIVLPLQRLGQFTTRLAWGDYQTIQKPVGGIQEIRDLQTTLTQMAGRLQQAQSGMHSYIGAMLQGQEDERKRLSRELHDDTLQALIALDQQRQMAQRALTRDPAKVADRLDQLRIMLDQTIQGLRRVLRDMRPAYIEDLGLTPALEALVGQYKENGPVQVQFTVEGSPRRLPANCELGLYRIAQEAVTNAIRHGKATQIDVHLRFDKPVMLSIQDNGQGFVVPERPNVFAQNGHYGLMGMVERTEQMQAQFRIDSKPGKGTLLEILQRADL